MKKIAICKYGQKIIFDRSSISANRSNTNGNVMLYKLLIFLFEKFNNDEFYLMSDYDVKPNYKNVYNYSKHLSYDTFILIGGLAEYENNEELINKINNIKCDKIILLSEDPRCITSISKDKRLNIGVDEIIGLSNKEIEFCGFYRKINYVPLELLMSYNNNYELHYKEFTNNPFIIANSTFSQYERINKLNDLIKFKIEHYGRLSEQDKKIIEDNSYITNGGELNYKDIISKYESHYINIVIPIEKGWVTSKYVESLLYNCMPLIYKDYNLKLIDNKIIDKYSFENSEELLKIINKIENNKEQFLEDLKELRKELIDENYNGDKLYNELKKYI